ncbi:MAG: hypothetical protein WD572_10740 [Gammaproteobacteria bacterium]
MLWARDIDGASRLVPLLVSSDMPVESRNLVALRQACAENKVEEAQRIVSYFEENHADDTSMTYISRMIMGREAEAAQVLMELDAEGDIGSLADYLSYAYFDARQFPNLMNMLETQGIEPRAPKKTPTGAECDATWQSTCPVPEGPVELWGERLAVNDGAQHAGTLGYELVASFPILATAELPSPQADIEAIFTKPDVLQQTGPAKGISSPEWWRLPDDAVPANASLRHHWDRVGSSLAITAFPIIESYGSEY